MKPIYIIQIGFSTLKDQNKWQGIFFLCVQGEEKSYNTSRLVYHTVVHFTERQVLKDHVQTQPTDFKIWVRSS